MIVSIEGILETIDALRCVINVQGIGYEVFVPLPMKLPRKGEVIKLQIYAVYREDHQSLYGFSTVSERDFFKLLVEKVSGIGPRVALAMFSHFNLGQLKNAIASKNTMTLSQIPGIGKKTAEKIILELSDKIDGDRSFVDVSYSQDCEDAILGLIALGYKKSEAETRIKKLAADLSNASADVLIRAAIAVK